MSLILVKQEPGKNSQKTSLTLKTTKCKNAFYSSFSFAKE